MSKNLILSTRIGIETNRLIDAGNFEGAYNLIYGSYLTWADMGKEPPANFMELMELIKEHIKRNGK